MEHDLKVLYEHFDQYLAQLQADVCRAIAHLPPQKARGFRVPRPGFAEFERLWHFIGSAQELLRQWRRRLTPTGRHDETMAIRSRLQQIEASPLVLNETHDAKLRAAS